MRAYRLGREIVSALVLCCVITVVVTGTWKLAAAQQPGEPAQPKDKTVKKLTRSDLLQILTEEVDVTMVQQPMKLNEFLNWLKGKVENKRDVKVPLLTDTDAFRLENPDAPDLMEITVKMPPLTTRLTFGEALNLALAQVPTQNAAFLIRKGSLEITTVQKSHPYTLVSGKVLAMFQKKQLSEALEELSEQTGLSIVIDPRIADKAATPVSAAFVNNSTLEAAVVVLTNMAGAEAVLLRDVMFITTAENAQKLRSTHKHLIDANQPPTGMPGAGPMIPGLGLPGMFPGPGIPGLPGA